MQKANLFLCAISLVFSSIKKSRIKSTLLTAKENYPINGLDIWLNRITDLVCVNDSLPIGFSTSPAISNSALMPFDDTLQTYCNSNDLVFTRYSNDIIVSSQDFVAL